MSEEVKDGELAADFMNLTAPVEQEAPAAEPEESEPVEPQQDNAEGEEQPEMDSEPTVDDDAEETIEGEVEEAEEQEPEQVEAETVEAEFVLPDGGKVNQKDLIDGYMRQADYTRKTAELAEQRKQGDQQLEEQNAQIAQVLEAMRQRYQAFDPRAPYVQALQEAQADGDTERAMQLQAHIQGLTSELENFEKAYEFETGKKQEKETKTKQEKIAFEREALFEKMPELKNPKKVEEFQKITTTALKRFGYSDNEIQNLGSTDHRDAMAYYYAGKYLDSMNKAPRTAEKLKGKAVTPKTQPRKAERDSAKKTALAKFNKNPNAEGSLAGLLLANGL